eukprot:GHVU01004844.1.p1 GENE.GHVU01004844.1~~GHVU01004844.1.p1  ORF type:complete len:246 (-),score=46.04 GHVU01004844.1:547-1284(-)
MSADDEETPERDKKASISRPVRGKRKRSCVRFANDEAKFETERDPQEEGKSDDKNKEIPLAKRAQKEEKSLLDRWEGSVTKRRRRMGVSANISETNYLADEHDWDDFCGSVAGSSLPRNTSVAISRKNGHFWTVKTRRHQPIAEEDISRLEDAAEKIVEGGANAEELQFCGREFMEVQADRDGEEVKIQLKPISGLGFLLAFMDGSHCVIFFNDETNMSEEDRSNVIAAGELIMKIVPKQSSSDE